MNSPDSSLTQQSVYQTNSTAIAVLTGLYASMNSIGQPYTGAYGISYFAGLSADEFTLFNGVSDKNSIAYYSNALVSTPANNYGTDFWGPAYSDIYVINDAITNLNGSTTITSAVKNQLVGEAKFLRAFTYFYLVNEFGGVPVEQTTNYTINEKLPRNSVGQVYSQS